MSADNWLRRASGLFIPAPVRRFGWYPCSCGGQGCTNCITGWGPTQWQVVIAGVVPWDPSRCWPGDCATLNDTWILDRAVGVNCWWEILTGGPECPATRIQLGILFGFRIHVRIRHDGSASYAAFEREYGAPIDCDNIAGDVVNFLAHYVYVRCDCSSATATVTALP